MGIVGSDLCLLSVHAHPDDESSKGAGTVARYHSEGVHTVLVCCTGGEEGDVLNPAMDTPEVRGRLGEIRREELARAAEIIGYDEVVMLGYRDSGMPGSPANENPKCFSQAPLDEAVGRLVSVIRRTQPQVVIGYGDDQHHYPHPDHLRAHEITVAAFERAGDPEEFPEAGPPWAPSKLYYTVWSGRRLRALHAKFLELGLESPFGEEWLQRFPEQDAFTTSIDLTGFAGVRADALRAHATQVDPRSSFWFGLPKEVESAVHPYDDYVLARSMLSGHMGESQGGANVEVEDDLFAGLR